MVCTPPSLRDSSLRVSNGVAQFTHQRAQARNALSEELKKDYAELIDWLGGNEDIRVLVVSGSGGSFCAGGDLKGMRERLQGGAAGRTEANRQRLVQANRWLARLHALEIPVIAAVDGPAYGAGFSLALQADFIFASKRARFCMSFARVGAVPDYGATWTLPRRIGLQAAKDLMYTGRSIDPEEASRMGLVYRICENEMLQSDVQAFASRLAKASRSSIAMTKEMLDRSLESDYAAMATSEASAQALAMDSTEHRQALERFAAGEPPFYDWDRDSSAPSSDFH